MITFNLRDFERAAARFDDAARQVPFALSQSLNDAVGKARIELVENTWPAHMTVRNKSFIGAALRREFASKTNLTAAVVESGPAAGRGNLSLHAQGGVKKARRNLAIAPSNGFGAVRRGAKGIPAAQRPRAVVDKTPKHALRITSKGIFVGKSGRLNLMFTLRPMAMIPAEVPFQSEFNRVVRQEVWRAFTPRLMRALRPRSR